jgi:hypothetical protein
MKLPLILLSFLSLASANNQDYGYVLFKDIRNNLQDYMDLFLSGGSIQIPDELGPYYQAVLTYTDESYSTLFSDSPASDVEAAVSQLPWYDERLSSKLSAALTEGIEASTTQVESVSESEIISTPTSEAESVPASTLDEVTTISTDSSAFSFLVPSYAFSASTVAESISSESFLVVSLFSGEGVPPTAPLFLLSGFVSVALLLL